MEKVEKSYANLCRSRNEEYGTQFTAHADRWKAWEWEGDEEFCVIAPREPGDLVIEGNELKHAVGMVQYVSAVSNGETNVMFIRRKGKEDEPFFTVEVDKDHKIRYVSGLYHCRADSVEGLPEFVEKWANLKNIQCYENVRRRLF